MRRLKRGAVWFLVAVLVPPLLAQDIKPESLEVINEAYETWRSAHSAFDQEFAAGLTKLLGETPDEAVKASFCPGRAERLKSVKGLLEKQLQAQERYYKLNLAEVARQIEEKNDVLANQADYERQQAKE
jgi:hypothetical protein